MFEKRYTSVSSINEKASFMTKMTSEIPIKDKFFMSDIEKYYKYGKFPYIMILQIMLVIFSTTLVNILNKTYTNAYTYNYNYNTFSPLDSDKH